MASIAISGEEAKHKIIKLVDEIKVAQLITIGESGELHARPMMAQDKTEDGEFWFLTDITSRKIDEIRHSSKSLLSYAHPGAQDFVSLSGVSEIVTSREKIQQLWSKDAELWFPKGPTDPQIALIRFQAENAEYWNSTSNALVFAYEYLKARLTQKPPVDLGEMGQVHYRGI